MTPDKIPIPFTTRTGKQAADKLPLPFTRRVGDDPGTEAATSATETTAKAATQTTAKMGENQRLRCGHDGADGGRHHLP